MTAVRLVSGIGHAALAASLALALAPAAAPPLAGDAPVDEATVDAGEIARMLEEGVPVDVVREWLASRPGRVAAPDPDTMIRLRRAGADEALLRLVVERSAVPAPASDPAPIATAPATPDADGLARVDLTIDYRPVEPFDGDDRALSPDLVVYVDGRVLARVPAQADVLERREPFRARLPPGRHVLRLVREFPDDPRAREAARVAPEAVAIDVDASARWELDLRWVDTPFSFGSPTPLSWELRRDGERLDGLEKGGTATDRWPEVCEDVEATLEPGESPGRGVRRRLEACVRWADLFEGVADLPPRRAARARAREGGGDFRIPEPLGD